MAYVNVAEWSPRHVAEWLRGLDDTVQPYVQFFLNNNINGCHLLTLASNDLIHLNVVKIGHQEIILEAVDLLRQLHYNLASENLQSLCLKLGCKARSLCNALKLQYSSIEKGKNLLLTGTLSSVSDILALVKILISWLDRYPFEGQDEYKVVRKTILQHSIELASTAQRDQFAEKPHEIIQKNCHNIAEQCDTIVQKFNDSLIIQPASLSVATIKKRSDEDLGIHIHSSYSGIHIIGAVKFQSPAYRCGKVCEGDEIIQVNYQTVVGWQLKSLVCATSEHPSEIHLTIKKRPHHSNALEEVITIWPFRIPSKRTAFRKMNKWSKTKSTHLPASEIYSPPSSSSSSSKNMNSSQHIGNDIMLPLDGIRQPVSQPLNSVSAFKRRPRVNRRATIDSVPPVKIHSPVNIMELKSAFKVIEPTNVREKYATYNANKTSDSGKPTSPRIFYPVPCKFGSTDSDKWKRENDKNHTVTDHDGGNSEMKYTLPDVHQEQFSILNCNRQNGYSNTCSTDDTVVETKTENTLKVQQYPSINSNLSSSCIPSNFVIHKDNISPTIKNDHAKIAETIPEEKTVNAETDILNCQEDSLECNVNNTKYYAAEEDLVNSPESDDRSDITRFQVVSFPSPGVNTRTFIKQVTRNKKPVQNITDEISETENPEKQTSSLTNQSDTDLSGQSDTSLEDMADNSKYKKQESSMALCQLNRAPMYNNISTNYKNNSTAREEMLSYRKQKNKVPRSQRRFTTDQPLLPREMESDSCSAFRPISGRSISCIDVSQIAENTSRDNIRNSNYLVSKNFLSLANEKLSINLCKMQNEPNREHCPPSNSEAVNYIGSLDRRTILGKYLDSNGICTLRDRSQKPSKNSIYKQKNASVSEGYVAKIAESFNSISRQQEIQLNMCKNEPPLLPTTTGQLYQPISSYASIMKPKPLRGDQLLAFMQNKHNTTIHERHVNIITPQENNCFQPTKVTTCTENNVKDSRKEYSDSKQINKLLRTATSEEIQNMYTTYGNSGRAFESIHTNSDTIQIASVREGQISTTDHIVSQNLLSTQTENSCKHHEFQASNQRMTTFIKKPQKQATEQLARKLKTLIFGEKEEKNVSEKNALICQPMDIASVIRSRVSAAVQTDILEDSLSCYEDSSLNVSFASQESGHGNGDVFNNKPCQNMSDDSVVYSSNSSLTSSASSGSHYYYVETQIRPELTISVPLVNQVPPEEISDSNRSSHLPRMGVAAMLGKKRTVSYGSSDSGSGEVNTRLEQSKDCSPTYKSYLGHSTVPIDV